MNWGERNNRANVEILAVDLARAERAAVTVDDVGGELARRGRLVAAAGPPGRSGEREQEGPTNRPARELVWTAATSSVHRFSYVTMRERAGETRERERTAYEEKLALDRDVVPRLKAEARDLRREILLLERELLRRGVDPNSVRPVIEWDRTLAVDGYAAPRYETNEDRRARAVEFFRRIG